MNIVTGIRNFLDFINDNWTTIIIIIGLIITLYKKVKDYISLSTEEKLDIAKAQISQIILELVSKAELDYWELSKAGSIKRAQVIAQIYADYPILSQIKDQDEIIAWIDNTIDEALETMNEVFEINEDTLDTKESESNG